MLRTTKKELSRSAKPYVSKAFSVATVLILGGVSLPSFSANECRIEYGYHTGSGFNRQDKVKKIYINVNQTKTINLFLISSNDIRTNARTFETI